MTVSVDMLFGKFFDPAENKLYAIGNGYHFVLSADFELLQQTICPIAAQMYSEYSNAFPVIRNSDSTVLMLPYFGEKFSKQLYQVGKSPYQTRILCSAPSCDFFCYCRYGAGKILAIDRQSKDWYIYNGLQFEKSARNYFPGHVNVNMAEFCGKIVIFAQESNQISVVIGDEQEVKECNRPACAEWYVEAIWLNLVFLSCEGQDAPFYCVFDILEEKVIAVSHENTKVLHFPFVAENGFFYNERVNQMDFIMQTLFYLDPKDNLIKAKAALSEQNNGLADYERDIYTKFGLIDMPTSLSVNFGKLARESRDIQEMIGRVYVDLNNKFSKEIDQLRDKFEAKIKALEQALALAQGK